MTNRLVQAWFMVILLSLLAACSARRGIQQAEGMRPPAQSSNSRFAPAKEPVPPYPKFDAEQTDEVESWSGVFPRPPVLEPQVTFWRNVYGTWSLSQVAFHDNRYMNVIYEVYQLPGEPSEGYTFGQKELIQERLDYWKYRLRTLEEKVAAGAQLNHADRRLMEQITQGTNDRFAVQGASERLRYQRGMRERFKRGLEISGMYDRHFREIFRRAGLPEDLAYLPHVESSFQTNARSSAGAVGMWQFTAGAAKMFMNGNASEAARLDPIASAHGAARYLSHAYSKLGSWPLAVTSYNHGIGGMQRAKNIFGRNFARIVKHYDHPLFGFASRNYYAEFLAARDVANDPERFFPEGVRYATATDWIPTMTITAPAITTRSREPRTIKPPSKLTKIEPSKATRIEPKKVNRSERSKVARVVAIKVTKLERPKVTSVDRKKTGRVPEVMGKSALHAATSTRQAIRPKSVARLPEPKVADKKAVRTHSVNDRTELRTAQVNSRSVQTPTKYR